jgi:hypothetical protein
MSGFSISLASLTPVLDTPSPNPPDTVTDIVLNTPTVKPVEVDDENNLYIFQCPHCEAYVQVEKNQVNCTIFRHGYYYENTPNGIILTSQVNPHAPKSECDALVEQGRVQGCCKPFRMVRNGEGYIVTVCDYI